MSCNQPLKQRNFSFGWAMSVGEDKPTKWVQREGQIMLSLKPNFGPYKNRWTKIHLLGFEKKFEQRKCSNDKFGVSFLNLRWRFCKRKEWDFSHKGWGGGVGNKDTPGSPRYWLPHITVFQAFRSCGRRKEIWAEKKTSEAFIISFTVIFFILWLYGCVTALLYQVSGSLATFKLAVSLTPVWRFSDRKKDSLYKYVVCI